VAVPGDSRNLAAKVDPVLVVVDSHSWVALVATVVDNHSWSVRLSRSSHKHPVLVVDMGYMVPHLVVKCHRGLGLHHNRLMLVCHKGLKLERSDHRVLRFVVQRPMLAYHIQDSSLLLVEEGCHSLYNAR